MHPEEKKSRSYQYARREWADEKAIVAHVGSWSLASSSFPRLLKVRSCLRNSEGFDEYGFLVCCEVGREGRMEFCWIDAQTIPVHANKSLAPNLRMVGLQQLGRKKFAEFPARKFSPF